MIARMNLEIALRQINSLASVEFDLEISHTLRKIIRDIENQAVRNGQPKIVQVCRAVDVEFLSIQKARSLVEQCIAVYESD